MKNKAHGIRRKPINSLKRQNCKQMLEVRIFGVDCPACSTLEQMVVNICAEKDIDADIIKVTEIQELIKAGITGIPGLVINGKVKLQGKLPTKSTLEHWIMDAVKQTQFPKE
jgi:small redox-active disulfide protein 2